MATPRNTQYGNIILQYPFEKLSRKLTLRKNKVNTPYSKTFAGVMYTQRANKVGAGGRQYFFMRQNARSTAPSTDELWLRNRFAAISRAVVARSQDMSKIDADQAAFLAQRNQPGGVQSMKAWYWMVCGEEWDDQHPRP